MSTAETKPLDIDTLYEHSMKLTPEQRLELSERLLLSVPPPGQNRTEEEWNKEIERRMKEMEDDPSIGIPAEEVMAKARRIAHEAG